MSKLFFRNAAALLAVMAAPAIAQVAPSQIKPGMQVYDAGRHLVGAVSKIDRGMAVVVTDKYEVPVNPASFALDSGGLYLSMTRDQLNSFYETNVMAADQSLAVGKPVKGLEGSVLGTIKSIDDAKVVVTLASGQAIELPRNAIVGGATGATVGVSAADLAKQLGAATADAPAPAPSAEGMVKAGATAN